MTSEQKEPFSSHQEWWKTQIKQIEKKHPLTVSSSQGGRPGDPHPHPEHGRFLRSVRWGEVRHAVRAGGLLHGRERHPAGQGWNHHRAQVPPQLLQPHHREVRVPLRGSPAASTWPHFTHTCSSLPQSNLDELFFPLKVEYLSGLMRAGRRPTVRVWNIFHQGKKNDSSFKVKWMDLCQIFNSWPQHCCSCRVPHLQIYECNLFIIFLFRN